MWIITCCLLCSTWPGAPQPEDLADTWHEARPAVERHIEERVKVVDRPMPNHWELVASIAAIFAFTFYRVWKRNAKLRKKALDTPGRPAENGENDVPDHSG